MIKSLCSIVTWCCRPGAFKSIDLSWSIFRYVASCCLLRPVTRHRRPTMASVKLQTLSCRVRRPLSRLFAHNATLLSRPEQAAAVQQKTGAVRPFDERHFWLPLRRDAPNRSPLRLRFGRTIWVFKKASRSARRVYSSLGLIQPEKTNLSFIHLNLIMMMDHRHLLFLLFFWQQNFWPAYSSPLGVLVLLVGEICEQNERIYSFTCALMARLIDLNRF